MVFNVADDVNHPDQASVSRVKQRKHATGRKGTLTTLMPKLKDQVPPDAPSDNNHTGIPLQETETATTMQASNNDSSTKKHAGGTDPRASAIDESVDKDKNEAVESKETDLAKSSSSEVKDLPSQNYRAELNRDGSEITRLKQLLLLQVSLISRQQDLLRLRDTEIMQLKTSNASYKCQLNRVRRRMSKKRAEGQSDESLKPSKRKTVDNGTDSTLPDDVEKTALKNINETLGQDTSTIKDGTVEGKKKFHKSEDFGEASDYISTASSRKDTVRVPTAFIEQKQAELMQAMMISPPDKAIRNFCEITNSSPPLDELPFKICDRCPHCVAIAQEITQLLKSTENTQLADQYQPKIMKAVDKDVLMLAAVVPPSSENEEHEYKVHGKKVQIMRTSVSYFRIPPTFDVHHWWLDLKCGSIKTDSSLKIPTWRENELSSPTDGCEVEEVEATDDQTFIKRHAKFEQDEKRRKRWDIQRIREFRYNEKLRQKLLKQGAVYEAPIVETFAGYLHDAESVEVHESIPVNVFGYPAPHMDPEEFDLTPMRGSFKSIVTPMGRKRLKRS